MSLGKTLFEANSRARLLEACPICSGLGEDSLLAISGLASERTYEKGEFLMQEGDHCSGFFLVLNGKIRVYKSSPSGKEKVLLIAGPGMTFGEDALFGDGVFLEGGVAMLKSTILLIPRPGFLGLLRQNSDLSFQVMESLCLWIKRLAGSVQDEVFLSAKEKVARYLLNLTSLEDGHVVTLPTKKKNIADQLGLAPETLSRMLHQFSEQSLITIDNKKIIIKDLDLLKEMCE